LAVNLGDDADTTGAVYGQLAGAYYGEKEIPSRWLSKLAYKHVIIEMADKLLGLSQSSTSKKPLEPD
jgi:ADP-ribosyl-[dinitrogen reductase] hydrolase